jgi:hypothetical protein
VTDVSTTYIPIGGIPSDTWEFSANGVHRSYLFVFQSHDIPHERIAYPAKRKSKLAFPSMGWGAALKKFDI